MIVAVLEVFTGEHRELSTRMDFSEFSYSWTCVIVFVLISLITMKKDLSIFVKFNTYGVIFTIIIVLFIVTVGIIGLAHGGYTFIWFLDNADMTKEDLR